MASPRLLKEDFFFMNLIRERNHQEKVFHTVTPSKIPWKAVLCYIWCSLLCHVRKITQNQRTSAMGLFCSYPKIRFKWAKFCKYIFFLTTEFTLFKLCPRHWLGVSDPSYRWQWLIAGRTTLFKADGYNFKANCTFNWSLQMFHEYRTLILQMIMRWCEWNF